MLTMRLGNTREGSAQQAHVAGQADEIHLGFVQFLQQMPIVGFAIQTFGRETERVQAEPAGSVKTGGVRTVGDDNRDFGAGNVSVRDVPGNGFEVRSSAA